jgi:hypothetical protein
MELGPENALLLALMDGSDSATVVGEFETPCVAHLDDVATTDPAFVAMLEQGKAGMVDGLRRAADRIAARDMAAGAAVYEEGRQ